jgi:probable rRNA maturation factor
MIVEEEAEPDSKAAVHVIFTDDGRLRELNCEFRAIDRPTDVLSFNIDEAGETGAVFGEVYISVPTAAEQAAAYGAGLAEEFIRLSCHGFLHLFGYDHMVAAEAAKMKEREDRYLDRLART